MKNSIVSKIQFSRVYQVDTCQGLVLVRMFFESIGGVIRPIGKPIILAINQNQTDKFSQNNQTISLPINSTKELWTSTEFKISPYFNFVFKQDIIKTNLGPRPPTTSL